MMPRKLLRAILVGVTAIFGGVAAAQFQAAAPPADNPIFVDLLGDPAARAAAVTALRQKAVAQGQVRVIVGLDTPVTAVGSLSAAEAAVQTARIHADQTALAQRAGILARAVTQFDTIPFVSLWVNVVQLNRVLADAAAMNVQEDTPAQVGLDKSAPFIKAPQIWNLGVTGEGYAIAILDTGISKTHPMLAGKVVSEACYSTVNDGQQISSFCPGGAGKATGDGTGVNCPLGVADCWHGTHVAGIAAGLAVTDGTRNLKGIAPSADLISIQVFSRQDGKAITFASDWIRGLERVFALRKFFKVAAVNLSFGSGQFTGPCDVTNAAAASAIRNLRDAGIATIAASMNDGYDNATASPACIGETIAVGATVHTASALAAFSNHAPWVRLLAPGAGIDSAKLGGGFRLANGTSAAAAHVAGAFTLMRNLRRQANVDDIAAALECSGPLVTRGGLARPRVDLVAARKYLLHPPATSYDFNFTSNATGWTSVRGFWNVISQQYQVTDNSAGYKLATVASCNESEDITAYNLWRVGPSNGDVQGVLFKAQVVNGQAISGYFAGYDRSGHAMIRRYDNFDLTSNTGQVTDLCTGAVSLSGDFNDVAVSTRGGTHTLTINGNTICTASDRAYGTGSAGILANFGTTSVMNGLALDEFTLVPVESPSIAAASEPGRPGR